MTTDIKRDPAIPKPTKDAVLARDRHRCRRCSTCHDLEIHHINMRQSGGTHAEDNLITLCHSCHREWHRHEPDFEKWLGTVKPTLPIACEITTGQIDGPLISKAWSIIKTLNDLEADGCQITAPMT